MKRLAIILGIGALVPITLALIWMMQPTDPINAANYYRIEAGMTERQVEQILGGPASGEVQAELHCGVQAELHCGLDDIHNLKWPKVWYSSGDRAITVYFQVRDGQHIVESKRFFDPLLWDRIKARWGGYQLYPGGGRAKRLEAAA